MKREIPTATATLPSVLPVFVYGTLKPGFRNWRIAAWVTTPATQPASLQGFVMRDLGSFPAIVRAEGSTVRGVLLTYPERDYEDALSHMDALEGYREGREGNLYNRELVEVHTATGTVLCHTYVWAEEYRLGPLAPVISSGVWDK